MVGDRVIIQSTSASSGVIEGVYPRRNHLIRPAVANIDQLVVVFAAISPEPDFLLMDRLTVIGQKNNLSVVICISKTDLDKDDTLKIVIERFEDTGYPVIGISNKTQQGFTALKETLKGKISTLSGPSGVGKSTLLNTLRPDFNLPVATVSEKTQRGKHTTTCCELLEVMEDSFVVDTPGFTSLELSGLELPELENYFPEFRKFSNCRYTSCIHENESYCAIKKAVEDGELNKARYQNYLALLKEIREKEVTY